MSDINSVIKSSIHLLPQLPLFCMDALNILLNPQLHLLSESPMPLVLLTANLFSSRISNQKSIVSQFSMCHCSSWCTCTILYITWTYQVSIQHICKYYSESLPAKTELYYFDQSPDSHMIFNNFPVHIISPKRVFFHVQFKRQSRNVKPVFKSLSSQICRIAALQT